MGNKSFSIIIPILNENENISILFNRIKKNCQKHLYEIIFVDDNSTDGSIETLKKIGKNNNKLKYFVRKNKVNDLCMSISLGISKSKYENILVMDGDLQHDPNYLPRIMEIFIKKNSDFLICVRDFKKNSGLSIL